MFTAYVIVAGLTAATNLAAGVADLTKARFVLTNSGELGISTRWLPALGWLKIAGAVGVVVGVFSTLIGIAAAVGLVLFFVGAVTTHARARVWHTIGYPAAFLALAAGTLVLTAAAR